MLKPCSLLSRKSWEPVAVPRQDATRGHVQPRPDGIRALVHGPLGPKVPTATAVGNSPALVHLSLHRRCFLLSEGTLDAHEGRIPLSITEDGENDPRTRAVATPRGRGRPGKR